MVAWIKEKVVLVKLKKDAIKDAAPLHEQICAKQISDDKKNDCNALLNAIIARRDHEEDLLLSMIDVALSDSTGRDAKLKVMTSNYNEADTLTTQMAAKFFATYPKH
jgi:hypothetical protein